MQIVLMIVVAILVFGLVIFIHELGHFIVAKRSGIKVNEFALGMGPTLFKVTKNGTVYALRAFPIGGFVSMEGESEESEDAGSFNKAPIWKRLLVIIAGAIMNVVLGFLALVVLVAASEGPILSKTVGEVNNPSSGLEVGDQFIEVNGHRCFILNDIFYEFARTQNGTFNLLVRRDGEKVLLENVTFDTVKVFDEDGEPVMDDATGKQFETLDIGFKVYGTDKNVGTVIQEAFNNTLSYGRLIYQSLFDLVTGRVAVNQLSGPVGIVSEIGKAVSIGWESVVQLLALITINLGVVNMLPLPALDGGKVLLLILEAIRRKPLKEKYEIAINIVGFALIICLMVFVSFNDIMRLVT